MLTSAQLNFLAKKYAYIFQGFCCAYIDSYYVFIIYFTYVNILHDNNHYISKGQNDTLLVAYVMSLLTIDQSAYKDAYKFEDTNASYF